MQRILDDIYAIDAPMGVPVHYIKPEEFKRASLFNPVSNQLKKSIHQAPAFQQLTTMPSFEFISRLSSKITQISAGTSTNIACVYRDFVKDFDENADFYNPKEYKQPNAGIILAPPQNITWDNLLKSTLGLATPNMPDHNKQIQFMHLTHEIGHAIGGGEPQADTFVATLSRKAYENNSHLICCSDFRAAAAIFKGALLPNAIDSTYGWGVVEGNDYIRGLDESVIQSLSEDEIKAIRFQKFDHHNTDIVKAATEIYEIEEKAFKAIRGRHFTAAANILIPLQNAAEIVKRDNGTSDDQHQILTRFQLACQRLSIGTPAYERPKNFINPDILESENAAPITFTPGEYIPEQ